IDRNKTRLGRFAAALAFGNRRIESVIYIAREQTAQLPAVAAGESSHNHLIGGACARNKVLGVKARIRRGNSVKSGRHGRSALGDILPALGLWRRSISGAG